MGARMGRTIADYLSIDRVFATFLLAICSLFLCWHRDVNPAALTVSPFVQTRDDFFHGSSDSFDISLLVATNSIFALLDDVALPACTDHVTGRIRRLYRYDFIVLRNQGNDAPFPSVLT